MYISVKKLIVYNRSIRFCELYNPLANSLIKWESKKKQYVSKHIKFYRTKQLKHIQITKKITDKKKTINVTSIQFTCIPVYISPCIE